MVGELSVGGIVIPVMIVRAGDKNAARAIKRDLRSITLAVKKKETVHRKSAKAEIKIFKQEAVNIGNLSTQYTELGKVIRLTAAQAKKMHMPMSMVGKRVQIMTKTTTKSLGMWGGMFGGHVEKMNRRLNQLRWTMVNVTFAAVALGAIAAPFVLATKQAMEFEKALREVQAVTGELPEDIGKIVLDARAGRPFERVEVSKAFLEFARAGFSAEESTAALSPILNLAQAGMIELGRAASLTAQILHQFNIDAKESSRVTDVLATVANKSRTDIEGIGQAMGYVGALAGAMGQDMAKTAGLVGLLTNKGFQNTRAGTSMRQVLAALSDTSEKAQKALDKLGISLTDRTGDMKQLSEFIEELYFALKGLTQGEIQNVLGEIFEVRALAAIAAFFSYMDEHEGDLDRFLTNMEDIGAAFVMSAIQEQASINKLKGAWEDFKDGFISGGNLIAESAIPGMTMALNESGDATAALLTGISLAFIKTYQFGKLLQTMVVPPLLFTMAAGPADEKTNKKWLADIRDRWDAMLGRPTRADEKLKESLRFLEEIKRLQALDTGTASATLKIIKEYPGLLSIVQQRYGAIGKEVEVIAEKVRVGKETLERYNKGLEDLQLKRPTMKKGEYQKEYNILLNKWKVILAVIKEAENILNNLVIGGKSANAVFGKMEDVVGKVAENLRVSAKNMLDLLKGEGGETWLDKLLGTKKGFKISIAFKIRLDDVKKDFITMMNEVPEFAPKMFARGFDFKMVSGQMLDFFTQIKDNTTQMAAYEQSIVTLKEKKKDLQVITKDLTAKLSAERAELSKLKKELNAVNKKISEMSKARFVGETPIQNILAKAKLWLKQNELAALGVGDAQAFINEQLALSNDEYDGLFERLSKINSEMDKNKNAFKAWQKTIKTAIRAEVEAGEELSKDVTNRVKTWQTALLGIQDFGRAGPGQTGLDDYINKLQLSYDVQFGGMHQEVQNFLDTQEDARIGIFATSEEVISVLRGLSSESSTLTDSIKEQTETVDKAKTLLDENKTAIEENSAKIVVETNLLHALAIETAPLITKFLMLSRAVASLMAVIGSGIGGGQTEMTQSKIKYPTNPTGEPGREIEWYTNPETGNRTWRPRGQPTPPGYVPVVSGTTGDGYYGPTRGGLRPPPPIDLLNPPGLITITDAIIRPGMAPIKLHPNDTIIATQNPGSGGNNVNVTVNMNATGELNYDVHQLARNIKRELEQ